MQCTHQLLQCATSADGNISPYGSQHPIYDFHSHCRISDTAQYSATGPHYNAWVTEFAVRVQQEVAVFLAWENVLLTDAICLTLLFTGCFKRINVK